MCKKWLDGLLSNAEYLHFLNFAANRSYNDATQYPVFPWVITDYKSDQIPEFTAKHKRSWRDLTKPIGALTPDKLDQSKAKYFELLSKSPNSSPFLRKDDEALEHAENDEAETEQAYMYMSHYSTPGIIFYYLLRKFPSYLIRIQNDEFGGPPDRIFHNLNLTWQNCCKVISDNKELIPEFYIGDGLFLVNQSNAELG